ncbi:MAG: diaminopimelate decarboxylase [Acidimicrobiia bacterium]
MSSADILPITWREAGGRGSVGGMPIDELADRHGTPLYVVDVAHLRHRMDELRAAFGPETTLAYAAKAFFCPAMAELIAPTDWWVDVVSLGEARVAVAGGVPVGRQLFHGNAKTEEEVRFAVDAGRVVVDDPEEVERLPGRAALLLRLNVDVGADTHPKIRTSGAGVQFGMDRAAAERALHLASRRAAEVTGVHAHVGSQISDPDTYRRTVEVLSEFIESHRDAFPDLVDLDVGGGFHVPYLPDDQVIPAERHARVIREAADLAARRLGEVRLWVEPGRCVTATAGLTLYRVVSRKGDILAVDGGLSDNLRPALYGARYQAMVPTRTGPSERPFRLVGRHCEAGDVLVPEVHLPASTGPGDLVVVPVTGAYGFTMASHYNLVDRPAVVFVEDGADQVAVPRRGPF